MALLLLIRALLQIEKPDFVESLAATTARSKKLKDSKVSRGENEISDFFLATEAVCKTIMKISLMTYPNELEDFSEFMCWIFTRRRID